MLKGSGDFDNLVAMNRDINRSCIEPVFGPSSVRPDCFNIRYKIEGEPIRIRQVKNKAGG